ncbi:MAG: DNA/RNA non-specific endonuclease [Rikenellaceae bacterium]
MARRTSKRKKGSHSLSKRTYYTLLIILLILIAIAVYFSVTAVQPKVADTVEPAKISITPDSTTSPQPTIQQIDTIKKPSKKPKTKITPKPKSTILELPSLNDSTYLYHNINGRYRVLYSPKNKIPLFVSYILTRREAQRNIVKRSNTFTSDPHYIKIDVELADDSDYRRSGYDRGHMLPSADRNDSEIENVNTFLYSNIAPQRPALNRGTINALEQKIREWAIKYDSLYIITGSILTDNNNRPTQKIGKGVAVPQYFYKVIAVKNDKSYKTIGFIMPNIESVDPNYKRYMVSVDEIEKASKKDFFHLLPDSIEEQVEKEIDNKFWK